MTLAKEYRRLATSGDKRAFLDFLCNNLPFASVTGNLEVAILDRERNRASKWRSWFEVRDSDWWVENINQRLVAIPEIILDFDPKDDDLVFIDKLTTDAEFLGKWHTGSRGVHVHLIDRELLRMPRNEREEIKVTLMDMVGADLQKASDRTMIALEGASHWKTGVAKWLM